MSPVSRREFLHAARRLGRVGGVVLSAGVFE